MSNVYDIFSGDLIYRAPKVNTDADRDPYALVKEKIEARFGDNLPAHFAKAMSKPQPQPYMHGDVTDVKYRKRARNFNAPMPVPCEVTVKSCRKSDGILHLGARCAQGTDEAFGWIDHKYQVTLNFLKSLPNGTRLLIDTRSDLVAHDDYVAELSRLNVSVSILYVSISDKWNRSNEPGAPSLQRRKSAVRKLRGHGIAVELKAHGLAPKEVAS